MSCGMGRRCGSDPAWLWLWHRWAATALTRPLAWEPPYAAGVALEKTTKKKKEPRVMTAQVGLSRPGNYCPQDGSIPMTCSLGNPQSHVPGRVESAWCLQGPRTVGLPLICVFYKNITFSRTEICNCPHSGTSVMLLPPGDLLSTQAGS